MDGTRGRSVFWDIVLPPGKYESVALHARVPPSARTLTASDPLCVFLAPAMEVGICLVPSVTSTFLGKTLQPCCPDVVASRWTGRPRVRCPSLVPSAEAGRGQSLSRLKTPSEMGMLQRRSHSGVFQNIPPSPGEGRASESV